MEKDGMNPIKVALIETLLVNGPRSFTELRKELDLPHTTLNRHLKDLKDWIKKEESKFGRYYIPKDKNIRREIKRMIENDFYRIKYSKILKILTLAFLGIILFGWGLLFVETPFTISPTGFMIYPVKEYVLSLNFIIMGILTIIVGFIFYYYIFENIDWRK